MKTYSVIYADGTSLLAEIIGTNEQRSASRSGLFSAKIMETSEVSPALSVVFTSCLPT